MDDKVYYPEVIQETPFPNQTTVVGSTTTQASGEVSTADKTKQVSFPTKKIAVEVIGSALNTKSRKILKEFEFTEHGAIQIGKYENGVSGDVRLTPDGITARDKAGNTTVGIDGDTGDAVFKGSVQAGSLITGAVYVGDNTIILDGENKRIIVNDGTTDRILIGLG